MATTERWYVTRVVVDCAAAVVTVAVTEAPTPGGDTTTMAVSDHSRTVLAELAMVTDPVGTPKFRPRSVTLAPGVGCGGSSAGMTVVTTGSAYCHVAPTYVTGTPYTVTRT